MKALCRRVILWRGSLLPLGCAAVVNPANAVLLINRVRRFWGRFATQREQAPSPQKPAHTVGDLQDITGQVFVLRQFTQVAVDVLGVDHDHLVVVGTGQVAGTERHLFQQALQQRVQAAGTDVLGLLVDLPGDLGNTLDAVRLELDRQAFGFQQCAILLGERGMRFAEDAFEVFRCQRLEFNADWQTTLQFRHQIARLAQVERAGGDEQDVVGLDHAQLGVDGAAFDQRQQVALHAFAGHIDAARVAALGHFVDFVDEHDTVLLDRFQGLGLQLFFVDQATGFFIAHQFQRFLDLELAAFLLALAHVGKQALQLVGHFFHARWRGDIDARHFGDFDFDLLVIQLTFAQALAEQLTGIGIGRLCGFFVAETHTGRRQQGVEDAIFGSVFGAMANLGHFLFAQQLDGGIGQITNDRFDVTTDIADFGELGRFDLDERRVGQFGQATGDLGFTDTGRADHQDVLGGYFNAQFFRQLHPAPAVTQRDGDGAFGIVLADDMAIEFVDDFAGSHGHNIYRTSSKNEPWRWANTDLLGAVLLLNGLGVVGEYTNVGGDTEGGFDDFTGRQVGLFQQCAGGGLSIATTGTHGDQAIFRFNHIAVAGDDQ